MLVGLTSEAGGEVVMQGMRSTRWSPYAVGGGIGVLSWFAFATVDRGLGITTAFEYAAALTGRVLSPTEGASNSYFASHAPTIGWEWMVVLGVVLGSLLSSSLSGDRQHATVPAMWRRRFGDSVFVRMLAAFAGGAVMMLGARLARGCTSGHGITGTMQLAVSSWSFIIVAFAVASLVALSMFGRDHSEVSDA